MIGLLLVLAALANEPTRLSLETALALVVERNPDLRSADLARSIADIDAARARLDRFSASVAGSAGAQAGLEKPWGAAASKDTTSTWDLRASVEVPLYAGGSVRAAIDAADAGARIAALDVEITERDLVRATYVAYWTVMCTWSSKRAGRSGRRRPRSRWVSAATGRWR